MPSTYKKSIGFRQKILLFTYTTIIAITLVTSLVYEHQLKKNIAYTIETKHVTTLNQFQQDLHALITDIEETATFLALDKNITLPYESNAASLIGDFFDSSHRSTLNYVTNIFVTNATLSSVIIYGHSSTPVFQLFKNQKNSAKSLDDIALLPAYKEAEEMKGKPLWLFWDETSETFLESNDVPRLTLLKSIVDPFSTSQLQQGFLCMTVDMSELDLLLSNIVNGDFESLIIKDSSDDIIYSYGNKSICESFINNNINESRYIVASQENPSVKWSIYYITDKSYFMKDMPNPSQLTLIIIIICILASFVLSYIFSKHINTPINNLLKSMKRFELGHFDEEIPILNNDEIGELGRAYNGMAKNTNELINKVYIAEMHAKQAELNLLQEQINPHFLYNTLDTIYWKLLSNNQHETSDMIYSLSQIFRLSLNNGQDFITIQEELTLVQNYLHLQKKRYKHKLDYIINCDDKTQHYIIPKLIIQPYVENAIVHNIDYECDPLIISIDVTLQEDKLQISIMDNGQGFDYAYVLVHKKCVALNNVKERLSIIYGSNEHDLVITSTPKLGTKISLNLGKIGADNHVSNDVSR